MNELKSTPAKKLAVKKTPTYGLTPWYRIHIMRERYGDSRPAFATRLGLSHPTLHRIEKGSNVTSKVKKAVCEELGYDADIWDAQHNASKRPLRDLVNEFCRWLDYKGKNKAQIADLTGTRRIEITDFLTRRLRENVSFRGRDNDILNIEKHVQEFAQSFVEIRGPSGSGKTELVRQWWIQKGKKRVDGPILAVQCRRFSTTDDLFDHLRKEFARFQQPMVNKDLDLVPTIVKELKSFHPKRALIVFDDLDCLMRNGTEKGLRFSRSIMRELVEALSSELKSAIIILTTATNLAHMFEGYPGYLSIDIGGGIDADSGARLLKDLHVQAAHETLKQVSRRLRGLPQNHYHFAAIAIGSEPETWNTLLSAFPHGSDRNDGSDLSDGLALNQLQCRFSPATINFLRVVAAMEGKLDNRLLDQLIKSEGERSRTERVFIDEIPGDAIAIDLSLDRTLGLVEKIRIPDAVDNVCFDMHLSTRNEILRSWCEHDSNSYERLFVWLARWHWDSTFPDPAKDFIIKNLPGETDKELRQLIRLVDSAIYLVKSSLPALSRAKRAPSEESGLDYTFADEKPLVPTEIQRAFSPYAPTAFRIRFAYRRIVAQRVERGAGRRYRYRLTRQFGRHEEKARFLALLTPSVFYAAASGAEPIDLLNPHEQVEILFDAGQCSQQLGWLRTAVRAFRKCQECAQNTGDLLAAGRANILRAGALMQTGALATADEVLAQAANNLDEANRRDTSAVYIRQHQLESFAARVRLLRGDFDGAAQKDEWCHQNLRDDDAQLLESVKRQINNPDHGLSPWIAEGCQSLPSAVLQGERGRWHMEIQLAAMRQASDDILAYWWACWQMALTNGTEIDQCRLHILEACIHRLRSDEAAAMRAMTEADRIAEHYNVHFPIRVELRLERAKLTARFSSRESDYKVELRHLESVIGHTEDYEFTLCQCDAWLVKAWLCRLITDNRACKLALEKAQGLIDQHSYQLRLIDLKDLGDRTTPCLVSLV